MRADRLSRVGPRPSNPIHSGGASMPGSPGPSRVRSLRSALALLRRPPAPQAVLFKPVVDAGDRCQLAAYTDVRFVIDQLNAVCGPSWSAAYADLPPALQATVAD